VTQPPAGIPFIEGTVASFDGSGQSIHVKEQAGSNEAVLRITEQTQLLKEFGGGYEPAAVEELREGQTVAAWVTGPVAESYPVQAAADAVLITGG
jgi:hypothetical protein